MDRLQSVEMAFKVLAVIAGSEDPPGVSDIARACGEQKARIQRHLVTLRSIGALSQDAAGKYRLGWQLVELGQKAIAQFDLVELAERDVKALRDRSTLTAALAIVAGRGLRIAYVAESPGMMAVTVRTGLAVPLHGSAAGRLLVAYERLAEGSADDLPRPSPVVRMKPDSARAAAIRARGHEYSVSEITSGVHSLAAPILAPDGRMIAALVCVGTHTQITDPPAEELVLAVKHHAQRIGQKLRTQSAETS